MRALAMAATLAIVGVACRVHPGGSAASSAPPPAVVIGEFEDDYGGRHSVSAREWIQQPGSRYHIARWVPQRQYLIAQNDSSNRSAPGKWTRIDWLPLTNMPPYAWAFCFSAYDAPTEAIAESTTVAHRETPRTGCNGFPFSRMRRR